MRTSDHIVQINTARDRFASVRHESIGAFPGRSANDRRSLFESFLSELVSSATANPALAPLATHCRLVQAFLSRADDLRLSRHIPALVYASSWFARTFSLRMSSVDANSLTVAEAIEMLPPSLRETGRVVLAHFLRTWDLLRVRLQTSVALSLRYYAQHCRLAMAK